MNNRDKDAPGEIPIGFFMALAQNSQSLTYFSSLDSYRQQMILAKLSDIRSKKEMKSFVDSLQREGPFSAE